MGLRFPEAIKILLDRKGGSNCAVWRCDASMIPEALPSVACLLFDLPPVLIGRAMPLVPEPEPRG